MADAASFLTQDIGPLPAWAWGATIGGGVVIGSIARKRLAARKAPTAVTVSPGTTGPTSSADYVPYGGGGQIGFAGGGAINATPSIPITTNSQWEQAALDAATAAGWTPYNAQTILDAYLRGDSVGSDGQALLDLVLAKVGLPPSPPSILPPTPPPAPSDSTNQAPSPSPGSTLPVPEPTPAPDVPAPPPAPAPVPDLPAPPPDPILTTDPYTALVTQAYLDLLGRQPDQGGLDYWAGELRNGTINVGDLRYDLATSPEGQAYNASRQGSSAFAGVQAAGQVPQARSYTVVRGDTLSGIASRYGTTYQAIAAANGIANPNKITPGQVLTIP